MSFTKDLIVGFGQLLAASNIGVAWPASSASGADVPIFAMVVPQSPDRVLTLSPVVVSNSPTLSEARMRLQVRSRSVGEDVSDVWALDDAVADVLVGNYPLTLSTGVYVETVSRAGGGSLGQDANLRWLWSSNYDLAVYAPGTHRL